MDKTLIKQQSGGRGFVTIRSGDGAVTGDFWRLEPQDSFELSDFELVDGVTMDAQTRARILARTHIKTLYLPVKSITLSSGECDAYNSVL